MIRARIIPYGGWKECLEITNGIIDLVVTLQVGPRIIRCGFSGERNMFVEYPEQMGKRGEDIYHSYGGHRLWVAPEEKPRTYYPDNHPVQWKQDGEWFHFIPPAESTTRLQKEIHLWVNPDRASVRVLHRITNVDRNPQSLAAWALSVMAPGGRAIIPHEPYRAHPESLLPVRPLVFWSYTDMTDVRWTWGKKYIQLKQDARAESPQKIGAFNSLGWCVYENSGFVFLKRFPAMTGQTYPDFGCNCELFTNRKMLEVESLSPLTLLRENDSIPHEEEWHLFKNVALGMSEGEIQRAITPLIGK